MRGGGWPSARPRGGSSGSNFWAGIEGTESERHGHGMPMSMARRRAGVALGGSLEIGERRSGRHHVVFPPECCGVGASVVVVVVIIC